MASTTTDRIDGLTTGVAVKAPVKTVAVSNITLSGEQTVNGVAVVTGDRVLVTAQTSSVDNGIYDVSTSSWTRSADFDGNRDVVKGTLVVSNTGTTIYYRVTSADPIVIGTSAVDFEVVAGDVTQSSIGAALYPRSAAEIAAGITPVDYSKPPGTVTRYAVNTTPGTTDMTAGIQAAVDQAENGGSDVYFPAQTFLAASAVTLPNANIRIYGEGTIHSSTAIANGIFYQTNRGALTEIEGVTCTGASPLFKYYDSGSLPHTTQYLEFRFTRVSFKQAATSYAVYLYGAREGSFTDCYFETCKGVYLDYTINTDFIGCHAKNCVNIVEAGSGAEGIKFIGGSALGCTYCIKATGIIGLQIVGVMWDYNDNPISLTGCQQIGITNSYITSRSTTAHVINIVPDGATRSEDIYIVGNPMLANVAASGTGRIIHAEDADYVTITGNQLKLWRDVAVYLDNCTQVDVANNKFVPYPATGNYSVQTATADTTVRVAHNHVEKPINVTTTRDIRNNNGYVTENSGEATLTSGAASRTIAHGLAKAPLKGDVKLTATSTLVTATHYWVSAVDATNITVTFDAAPGADVTMSWSARVSVG